MDAQLINSRAGQAGMTLGWPHGHDAPPPRPPRPCHSVEQLVFCRVVLSYHPDRQKLHGVAEVFQLHPSS